MRTTIKNFRGSILACFLLNFLAPVGAQSEQDEESSLQTDATVTKWTSVTIDNDIIIGGDGGYTNGLILSWYDVADKDLIEPGWLVSPFVGWLNHEDAIRVADIYTVGQMMATPDDIEATQYLPNDIPYTGLLYFSNNYLVIAEDHVDDLGVTLGVVGPASGAEKVQRWVHEITGSDEPRGWANQTRNELVFQLKRGRTYRNWVGEKGNADFLTRLEAGFGTINTSVNSSAIFRWGKQLDNSYGSVGLGSLRTTNPLALDDSWYFYAEVGASYLLYTVFLDGNTFKESNSIDYNRFTYGASVGFAYAWDNWTFTLAVANRDIGNNAFDNFNSDYNQFGTFTIAWRGD